MHKILQSDQSLDTYLFQLIVPMQPEIGLGIWHLLLWGKPIHVHHQWGGLPGPMMPPGCSKGGHSIPPLSDGLTSSCRRIRNQILIKPNREVIFPLHEVDLLQDFSAPKVFQMNWILHLCNNTRRITTWLAMQPLVKHKILQSDQLPGHSDLTYVNEHSLYEQVPQQSDVPCNHLNYIKIIAKWPVATGCLAHQETLYI